MRALDVILTNVLLEATNVRFVAEHEVFRSADGSATFAGLWMVGIGIGMVLASIANLLGRGPARRMGDRVPRALIVAWGCLGLAVGGCFIAWPFLASPGVL